ncbi:hypothetical protein AVEN_204456-1 [Araneus ventricosus]|uniref:Uncharacterized protein n=1 Tax=Araneus ventricosus TaxID=182803 RepID=A0A4Y2KC63_ARAVE|nr:hypothetical protein AVEN_204392-1 [Araneus ventricosus]GBN40777.1 hypothetical protein AVEN_204456-1 [Araneus ventricosus]
MKDRPPRQHSQGLRFLHYSPLYERLMQQTPGISGYDLFSEMGPKSHSTIIVPSGRRESAYLYVSLSSVNSRCPPPRWGFRSPNELISILLFTHILQGCKVTSTSAK